jgi:hypothetical protein
MMLSAAFLGGDVLFSGVSTKLQSQPTQVEIMQAWDQEAK